MSIQIKYISLKISFRIKILALLFVILTLSCCGDYYDDFQPNKSNFFGIEHPSNNVFDNISSSNTKKHLDYLIAFKKNSDLSDQHFVDPYVTVNSWNEDMIDMKNINHQIFHQLHQKYVLSGITSSVDPVMDLQITKDIYQDISTGWYGLSQLSNHVDKFFNPNLPNISSIVSVVRFESFDQAKKVLNSLFKQNKIWYAEPDQTYDLKQQTTALDGFRIMNKNYQNEQIDTMYNYHIKNTKIDRAIDNIAKLNDDLLTKMLKNPPIIAIMDSGVDVKHNSLKNRAVNLTKLKSTACGNGRYGCNTSRPQSKDGRLELVKGVLGNTKTWPATTKGFNQPCPPGDTRGNCEHGTHVAGIAVGYDSSQNIYGACPFCLYLPIKVVNDETSITDSALLRGYQYVSLFYTNHGKDPLIRVINASLGTFQRSRSTMLAVRNLQNNGLGILIVAAAGNEDSSFKQYPAAMGNVVAVSNVDKDNKKHLKSNYGHYLDIAAPGHEIYSAQVGGNKKRDSGTSMSAPLVAGIAGLVLAIRPGLSADQLKNIIVQTSNRSAIYSVNKDYRIVSQDGSKITLLGDGLVNAEKAILTTSYQAKAHAKAHKRIEGCSNNAYGYDLKSQSSLSKQSKSLNYMKIDKNFILNQIILFILPIVWFLFSMILHKKNNQQIT